MGHFVQIKPQIISCGLALFTQVLTSVDFFTVLCRKIKLIALGKVGSSLCEFSTISDFF